MATGQPSRGLISWLEEGGYAYEGGPLNRRSLSGLQHMSSNPGAIDNASAYDRIRRIESSTIDSQSWQFLYATQKT